MKTMTLIGHTVPRIGFGTMRLPGENVMGPPKDFDRAINVLRRVYELGIKVIDTAWYYGPDVADELVAEALHPYPEDMIIITKLGGKRDKDGNWLPANTPEELRRGMERDLRLLKLDAMPIVHLRWMGKEFDDAFRDAFETMLHMKQEGLIKHIGLSNVTEEHLDYALARTSIATVSNAYSLTDRHDDPIVDRTAKEKIAYLPYFPLAVGKVAKNAVLQRWSEELQTSPAQLALSWLLERSPNILPIPGTSSIEHLEENFAALELDLPKEAFDELSTV
jgi:aryl-alcohol dehydrogenase-like predicted oxidoreductase